MRVVVVGRGRVGRAVASALRGHERVQVMLRAGRSTRLPVADLVMLAVPDSAIAGVAAHLAPRVDGRTVVVHCAGARGPGDLEPCAWAGAHVGVMHPLVSFPVPGRAPSLVGATFVVSGDRAVVAACRAVARALDATVIVADVHGPAYHAAAALVANGAAALAAAGVDVLERLGLSRRAAERALGGLLRTVADNVERVGVPDALSGPIRRGDVATIRSHRGALATLHGAGLPAYDAVAPVVLDCARRAGLAAPAVTRLRRALARKAWDTQRHAVRTRQTR